MSRFFRRNVFELVLVVLLVITSAIAIHQRVPSHPFTLVSAAYIPPGSVFGLTGVHGVISSPYNYEAALLDYSPPVEDSDYLLGYGVSEPVRLPGGSWDHYRLVRTVWVQGSGWVEEWEATNGPESGARFAYLHLQWVVPSSATAIYAGSPLRPNNTDATTYALGHATTMPGVSAAPTTYHGGQIVAQSGWPSDPAYGNGLAGPANSQLCLLSDANGAGLFFRVAAGYDQPKPTPTPTPKPAAFPAKRFEHYRTLHHLKPVPYQDKRHHLTWAASLWSHHRWLGGIKSAGSYHKGRPGYDLYPFEFGRIYAFPKTGEFKITQVRRG